MDPEGKNVPINACVVYDEKDQEYHVFLTTDTEKTARYIVQIYEMCPEIEEDFKSTKYNYISFHIVMTIVSYLYFQLYKNMEEGEKLIGKSLPVTAKNYKSEEKKDGV